MIELALALPVFLLFLFGALELGIAFYTMEVLTFSAREGSRWASVRGSTCYSDLGSTSYCMAKTGAAASDIQTYVQGLGFAGLKMSAVTVSTTWYTGTMSNGATTWATCTTGTCNAPANIVQVQVSYPFFLNFPVWKSVSSYSLRATSASVVVQ